MAEDTGQRESRNKHEYLRLCVIVYFLLVPKASTTSIIPVSREVSWSDARAHCKKEYNGDLYIPEPFYSPSNLIPYKYYWVGAMEISEWKWTDSSSPFRYIRYQAHFAPNELYLPGNSLAQCYGVCSTNINFRLFGLVGLSGYHCYCLNDSQVLYPLSRAQHEHPCPGNFGENCGTANGMSVYKTDIPLSNSRTGRCVLIYSFGNHYKTDDCNNYNYAVCSNTHVQDRSSSCNGSEKYRRCSEGICSTCSQGSWSHVNNTCELVKVTKDNKDNIVNILSANTPYWIGLHRISRRLWINGIEVNNRYQYKDNHDAANPTCLALRHDGYNLTSDWIPCQRTERALCVNNSPAIETTTKSKSSDLGKTSGSLPISRAIYGLYIGTGIGALLLAILITAVIVVLKRKEKICFREQQQVAVHFQAAPENPTYDSLSPEQDQEQPYTSLRTIGQASAPPARANPCCCI